ncbi:MAG: iron ABC transporter permease [Rhodospirillales bacterium]|nr:iron ABC transporter permease [Rhodospirillales bacterium]
MTSQTNNYSTAGYKLFQVGQFEFRLHAARSIILSGLGLVLVCLGVFSLGLGSQDIAPGDIFSLLTGGTTLSPSDHAILVELRLPRLVLAIICGAMLGLSGAAMQSLTRNGLADPGLLGVREGCILVILFLTLTIPAMPMALRPILGTIGGLAVAAATVSIARSTSNLRFVLIGIGISWLLSAVIAMVLVSLDSSDAQPLLLWITGSLSSATWNVVPVAFSLLMFNGLLLLLASRSSEILSLGAQSAIGLGVNLRRTSIIQLVAATMLSATCVSTIGGVGFIGLIAPHMTKLVIGNNSHASVLTGSAVFGGLLLLGADTIGRVSFLPLQLPAGIILAAIGVPVLLMLLWKRRDEL